MDKLRFDIWMRDPYRSEPGDGPYIGYALHHANRTIQDVTETLLFAGYWDVAVVETGSHPFVKGVDGSWARSESLYMVAQCIRPLTVPPGEPKSLAELFKQAEHQ